MGLKPFFHYQQLTLATYLKHHAPFFLAKYHSMGWLVSLSKLCHNWANTWVIKYCFSISDADCLYMFYHQNFVWLNMVSLSNHIKYLFMLQHVTLLDSMIFLLATSLNNTSTCILSTNLIGLTKRSHCSKNWDWLPNWLGVYQSCPTQYPSIPFLGVCVIQLPIPFEIAKNQQIGLGLCLQVLRYPFRPATNFPCVIQRSPSLNHNIKCQGFPPRCPA